MVSAILMPAMVVAISLPSSRIWTRVRFTLLLDRYRATSRLISREPRPTRVIQMLYRIITTR